MSLGGRPLSRCVNCGALIPAGRLLCMTGPCSEPAPLDWEPKTEWGKSRKAERDRRREEVAHG